MTTVSTARPRAFAVWFKDLDRWNPGSFVLSAWSWPKEFIKPLSVALKARHLAVSKEHPILPMITIRFDGEMEQRSSRVNNEIKGKLFLAHAGDVVYSKIDVRNGAIGIVPESLPVVAVTNEFPVYEVRKVVASPMYIKLLFRTEFFRRTINSMISGASGRKRVQPAQLVDVVVPLPSLSTQQAIVDRWQQAETDKNFVNQSILARRQALEKALLQELGITVDSLFPRQRAFRLDWNKLERWDLFFYRADFVRLQYDLETLNSRRLGEIAHFITRPWSCENFREETFRYIEISSVNKNKGITGTRLVQVSNAPSRATTLVKTGDLLISTTRPYLGGFAIVPEEYDNCVCTSGFSVIGSVNNTLIDKYFLLSFLKSDAGLKQMERRMTGGLYPAIVQSELENILIPLIPLEQQKEFVRREALINKQIVEHINKLEKHVEQTNIDIEAMILGTKKVG